MAAIRFTDAAGLRRELVARGLLGATVCARSAMTGSPPHRRRFRPTGAAPSRGYRLAPAAGSIPGVQLHPSNPACPTPFTPLRPHRGPRPRWDSGAPHPRQSSRHYGRVVLSRDHRPGTRATAAWWRGQRTGALVREGRPMKLPLEITFRNVTRTEELEERIRAKAAKLDKYVRQDHRLPGGRGVAAQAPEQGQHLQHPDRDQRPGR